MRSFKNLEKIGEGDEKEIYQDPDSKGRVIARIKERENPSQRERAEMIKARYYLSKIVHMLFPDTVPDIFGASFEEERGAQNAVLKIEKKSMGPKHEKIEGLKRALEGTWENADDLAAELHTAQMAMRQHLKNDPQFKKFFSEMDSLGIMIDASEVNFGYDDKGKLIYVDNSFRPWHIDGDGDSGPGRVVYHFDERALEKKIASLPEEDRVHAVSYFERLKELADEDLNNWNKSHVEFS